MSIVSLFSIKQRAFDDAQTNTTLSACPYLVDTDAHDIYKKYFEIERANIDRAAQIEADESAIQTAAAADIKASVHLVVALTECSAITPTERDAVQTYAQQHGFKATGAAA